MKKVFQNALREISRSRCSYFANIIVYAFMVAVLAVMAGVARSSEDSSRDALRSIGTHILVYRGTLAGSVSSEDCCDPSTGAGRSGNATLRNLEGFVAGNSGIPSEILNPSYADSLKKIDHVAGVSPYITYRFTAGRIFTAGGYRPEDKTAVNNTVFSEGNLVEGKGIAPGQSGKIVLEKSFSDSAGISVGKSLTVGGVPFEVVGIVNPPLRPGKADIYMHFDDLRSVLQKYGYESPYMANSLLVEVSDAWYQDEVILKIRDIHPELSIYTYGCYKPASKGMAAVSRHSGMLVVIIWLGLLTYAGTMQWTAVRTKKREIGILKSLGWSSTEIAVNIMLRGFFVAVAGSVLGMLCGAYILSRLEMSPVAMIPLFAISVFGGILSGLPSLLYAVNSREVTLLKRF
ncbi:hypothetical protein MASR1M66_20260 [Aminivibrio sp.]